MKAGKKKPRDMQLGAEAVDPRFAPVIAAFARDALVTRGKMFGSIGLKVNGKVFAILVKGKFVAKLARNRVDAIVAAGSGEYFDPGHGRPSKGWVSVAGEQPPWVELAEEAYRFVKGN
jgi:TfoX/Sxy family transcriptional regulator of competence genes